MGARPCRVGLRAPANRHQNLTRPVRRNAHCNSPDRPDRTLGGLVGTGHRPSHRAYDSRSQALTSGLHSRKNGHDTSADGNDSLDNFTLLPPRAWSGNTCGNTFRPGCRPVDELGHYLEQSLGDRTLPVGQRVRSVLHCESGAVAPHRVQDRLGRHRQGVRGHAGRTEAESCVHGRGAADEFGCSSRTGIRVTQHQLDEPLRGGAHPHLALRRGPELSRPYPSRGQKWCLRTLVPQSSGSRSWAVRKGVEPSSWLVEDDAAEVVEAGERGRNTLAEGRRFGRGCRERGGAFVPGT